MNNGNTEEVIKEFNKIALLPYVWNHYSHYINRALKKLKNPLNTGVDICGQGYYTKILCKYCSNVIGIDTSFSMIEEAKKRNCDQKINYIGKDVDSFLDENKDYFDLIISSGAFHHMDFGVVIEKCKKSLSQNGVLIILDFRKNETIRN